MKIDENVKKGLFGVQFYKKNKNFIKNFEKLKNWEYTIK